MNSRKRVWITGDGGLIGGYLTRTASRYGPAYEAHGTTRQACDLIDPSAVRQAFRKLNPDLVIHCAALTKSPACERNPDLARRVNVEATARLAELAQDVAFIFFSTDLVFDGEKGDYDELAEPNPLSMYGKTKMEAEIIVLANPKHTVIRTSLTGGISRTGDRGFNEEMLRAWQEGRTLTLFVDEFRCPIPAAVTARAVWELAAGAEPGLYHLAGAERLSRWQIGQVLAQQWPHLNPKLEPASRRNYDGPPRPADTSLNCAKIQKLLSFRLPGLTEKLVKNPNAEF